jgi:hypothetical protein
MMIPGNFLEDNLFMSTEDTNDKIAKWLGLSFFTPPQYASYDPAAIGLLHELRARGYRWELGSVYNDVWLQISKPHEPPIVECHAPTIAEAISGAVIQLINKGEP